MFREAQVAGPRCRWEAGPVLLAHQGGWDEILFVAAPILLFALLLWMANRRAAALRDAAAEDIGNDGDSAEV